MPGSEIENLCTRSKLSHEVLCKHNLAYKYPVVWDKRSFNAESDSSQRTFSGSSKSEFVYVRTPKIQSVASCMG